MRLIIWASDIACPWEGSSIPSDIATAVSDLYASYAARPEATYEVTDVSLSTDTAVYEVLTDRLWDARDRWQGKDTYRWFENAGFVEGVDYRFVMNVRADWGNADNPYDLYGE